MSAIKAFLVVSALCFLAVSSVYGDVLRFMPEKGRRKEDLRIKQTWDWVARPSFSAEAQELPLDVEDEGPRQRKPSSSKGKARLVPSLLFCPVEIRFFLVTCPMRLIICTTLVRIKISEKNKKKQDKAQDICDLHCP